MIWNVRLFYLAAGFALVRDGEDPDLDLLVILRGDPGQAHREHRGIVHVYDYVKELQVDWPACFPRAREIRLVSLFQPDPLPDGVRWVPGYLPVIPEFWQRHPFRKKARRPLHIANFKPMGDDPYQRDLARLARHGLVRVYGARWDRLGLATHGLSYLEANRRLADAWCCYGLMYPYQRGATLSGRMWQAPLHGCQVISEQGTPRDPRGGALHSGDAAQRGLDPGVLADPAGRHPVLARGHRAPGPPARPAGPPGALGRPAGRLPAGTTGPASEGGLGPAPGQAGALADPAAGELLVATTAADTARAGATPAGGLQPGEWTLQR